MNVPPIRRVHLISKTHLDIGFTDFAQNVTATYLSRFIPTALAVAKELRQASGVERLVWTTGAWLIYEFLERATPEARADLEQGIAAGDIRWHAMPFTPHSELMDPDLFRFGLSLAQELDTRYGIHTIAAKLTDVPGHTRGIVPLLAQAGVQFLHIGVNAASTAPAVPPVFVWRAPDGSDVMVMYQRGSYGALQVVPGLDEAIAFAHTQDNEGPQSVDQVRETFARLRHQFPHAEIVASTMDAFARALATLKEQLPVITQEIGDSWIHGIASDPQKVSRFRELLRMRRGWLEGKGSPPDDMTLKRFSRALLMVPEHTWGLDVKTHLADYENYRWDLFRAARVRPNFQKMEKSWREQRAYLDGAIRALGETPAARDARRAVETRKPGRPRTTNLQRLSRPFARLESERWQFQFDKRGALVSLRDKRTRREWAGSTHPLGLVTYETFSQADYDRFYKQYNVHRPENAWWSIPDFTKPGMAAAKAKHQVLHPHLQALYVKAGQYVLEMTMPKTAVTEYGAPQTIFLNVGFPEDKAEVRFTLQWFDKHACRLPEAIWFSFSPRVPTAAGWTMDKLGQTISPLQVVRDGNRHLHGVGRGVKYSEGNLELDIEARDAPLVAPGARSLLRFTNRRPPLTQGMHFLLFNNVWGTNFPMWNEEPARFEFILRASEAISVQEL